MENDKSITKWFGENLATLISDKIQPIYNEFDSKTYFSAIKKDCQDLSYSKRIELHADVLYQLLPESYPKAVNILMQILGSQNPNEVGMFTNYYWIMPIGKFVEKYGLEDYDISIKAIEEITKRNTGEYAIRPFIRKYPEKTLKILQQWSKSKNFHLRRLASEGSRPKLPWSAKLDTFIQNPDPIFKILENLMTDDIKFVQKSVANNLADYFKVNKPAALGFVSKFSDSDNKNTNWIIKHAMRNLKEAELFFKII